MPSRVRPPLATGIVLVGASMIAVSTIAPPPGSRLADIHVSAVDRSDVHFPNPNQSVTLLVDGVQTAVGEIGNAVTVQVPAALNQLATGNVAGAVNTLVAIPSRLTPAAKESQQAILELALQALLGPPIVLFLLGWTFASHPAIVPFTMVAFSVVVVLPLIAIAVPFMAADVIAPAFMADSKAALDNIGNNIWALGVAAQKFSDAVGASGDRSSIVKAAAVNAPVVQAGAPNAMNVAQPSSIDSSGDPAESTITATVATDAASPSATQVNATGFAGDTGDTGESFSNTKDSTPKAESDDKVKDIEPPAKDVDMTTGNKVEPGTTIGAAKSDTTTTTLATTAKDGAQAPSTPPATTVDGANPAENATSGEPASKENASPS